jgi:hypothetical protein
MLKAEDLNPERRGSHAVPKKQRKQFPLPLSTLITSHLRQWIGEAVFFVLPLQAIQQPFSIFGIEDA